MCNCITKYNESLEERGLELEVAFSVDFATGGSDSFIPVHTVRINTKSRVKEMLLKPKFCPLCGEKIGNEKKG